MRTGRRRLAVMLTSVLVTSLVTTVVSPAAWAGGPSVPLPGTPSTSVSEQKMDTSRGDDDATTGALHGDQPASTSSTDGGGTSKASPLSPSAKWDVSGQTGDFTWSYPMRVPPVPGGLSPQLALSYASSTVDGRTSATNNQASWIGDGWDMSVGFIERSYMPCANDTMDGTTPPKESGDECWRSDNATASFAGAGGDLILDKDKGWHLRSDDGARVERFGNPGDANESWKITKVDGTQYFFGSRGDAASTWKVPVYGDDVNEPCHQATFESSQCVMPWRWNLDKVVDRNGNEILYDYDAETNSYGMDNKDAAVSYTRGGTLKSAQYGLNTASSAPAAAKVDFLVADRCVPGSNCTPDKKENWPDVPWDDKCDTATCKDKHVPSFWSTKRLDKVVTSVRDGSGYRPVERWELDQQFPVNGDGEKPALWLKGVKHFGLAGGSVELPEVKFEGTKMPNRVQKLDGIGPLLRYRITAIESETGGLIEIKYAAPDCVSGQTMPAPENNTLRCYPVKWAKKDFAEQTDYFQKYVVEKITESDRIATNPAQETTYAYLDGAAWAWDDSEFTKDDHRNYNVFHGFGRVQIRKGVATDPSGPVTKSEERYYRGMKGDRLPSGTRSAQVVDSENAARDDERWLQGQKFETDVFDGDTDKVVSKTISTPAYQGPTATRGIFQAYMVNPGPQTTYTALAAGGWRTSRTEPTYNSHGQVTKLNDLGDTTTAADDKCTTTTYAENTGSWLLNLPSLVTTVAKACTTIPRFPDDAVAATRNVYDGLAPQSPPLHGNVTRTEDLDQWTGDAPVTTLVSTSVYDAYGRVTSQKDAKGNETKTAYTPADGGPTTQVAVTNAAGFTTTTTLETSYGQSVLVKDVNGFVTETAYDPMGRKTEVWLPNRPRTPGVRGNQYFAYTYRQDQPTVVSTTSIGPNGNYTTSNEIYDGMLRLRQKQSPATNGGRLIVDTRYDSQGRAFRTTSPYYNDAAVDDKLWIASDADIPSQIATTYDGAGREKVETLKSGAADLWHGTVDYGGDRVTVTPPAGSTATTVITDARNQPVELRQYHGATPTGVYDTTKYSYTPAGGTASITDPAGQVWQRSYDLHGRKTVDVDPDKGTTILTYNVLGQLATRKDARGTTLAYDYDVLGRKRTERLDSATGPVQAEWTYDSVDYGKGLPATTTRYVNGLAYSSKVEGYDPLGRAAGTTVTVPASRDEPGLAGSYSTYMAYKVDGHVDGRTYAQVADLPAESVSYTYDDLGHALTATGGYGGDTFDYVTKTEYTPYGEVARTQLGDDGKRVWLSRYYDIATRRLARSIVDAELPSPKQSDVNYTYDPSGNITSVADKAPGQTDTQCFRYDYLQRLTEAWTPTGDCAADPSVAALGGVAPYWQSFTYDVSGNRLSQTQHAASGNTVQTSTYPGAGQPHAHSLQSVATKGPGVDSSGQITYDAAGNVKTKPGQALDWDAEGHLAKVTQGTNVTEYVYDADGNRLLRRDPTGSTLYLDGQELRVTKATGKLSATRYYQHAGQTVAMRDSSGLTWLASDQQGTAQIAINSDKLQVVRRYQTPFGGARGAAVTFPGEKGFVGGTNDASTGLVHLGAREYDPTLGRFLSVDPVLNVFDPQQMAGYTYADNSPITKMDPTGRNWFSILGAVAGIVAIAATGPVGWIATGIAVAATAIDTAKAIKRGDTATAIIDGASLFLGGAGAWGRTFAWMNEGVRTMRAASEAAETYGGVADAVAGSAAVVGLGTDHAYEKREEREHGEHEAENAESEREHQEEWESEHAKEIEAYENTDAAYYPSRGSLFDEDTTKGWGCHEAGHDSTAGPYPCSAPFALLNKARYESYCKTVGSGAAECVTHRYIDTRHTNLGNGLPPFGKSGHRESQLTKEQAQQQGLPYYETNDHKYRMIDGHGALMS